MGMKFGKRIAAMMASAAMMISVAGGSYPVIERDKVSGEWYSYTNGKTDINGGGFVALYGFKDDSGYDNSYFEGAAIGGRFYSGIYEKTEKVTIEPHNYLTGDIFINSEEVKYYGGREQNIVLGRNDPLNFCYSGMRITGNLNSDIINIQSQYPPDYINMWSEKFYNIPYFYVDGVIEYSNSITVNGVSEDKPGLLNFYCSSLNLNSVNISGCMNIMTMDEKVDNNIYFGKLSLRDWTSLSYENVVNNSYVETGNFYCKGNLNISGISLQSEINGDLCVVGNLSLPDPRGNKLVVHNGDVYVGGSVVNPDAIILDAGRKIVEVNSDNSESFIQNIRNLSEYDYPNARSAADRFETAYKLKEYEMYGTSYIQTLENINKTMKEDGSSSNPNSISYKDAVEQCGGYNLERWDGCETITESCVWDDTICINGDYNHKFSNPLTDVINIDPGYDDIWISIDPSLSCIINKKIIIDDSNGGSVKFFIEKGNSGQSLEFHNTQIITKTYYDMFYGENNNSNHISLSTYPESKYVPQIYIYAASDNDVTILTNEFLFTGDIVAPLSSFETHGRGIVQNRLVDYTCYNYIDLNGDGIVSDDEKANPINISKEMDLGCIGSLEVGTIDLSNDFCFIYVDDPPPLYVYSPDDEESDKLSEKTVRCLSVDDCLDNETESYTVDGCENAHEISESMIKYISDQIQNADRMRVYTGKTFDEAMIQNEVDKFREKYYFVPQIAPYNNGSNGNEIGAKERIYPYEAFKGNDEVFVLHIENLDPSIDLLSGITLPVFGSMIGRITLSEYCAGVLVNNQVWEDNSDVYENYVFDVSLKSTIKVLDSSIGEYVDNYIDIDEAMNRSDAYIDPNNLVMGIRMYKKTPVEGNDTNAELSSALDRKIIYKNDKLSSVLGISKVEHIDFTDSAHFLREEVNRFEWMASGINNNATRVTEGYDSNDIYFIFTKAPSNDHDYYPDNAKFYYNYLLGRNYEYAPPVYSGYSSDQELISLNNAMVISYLSSDCFELPVTVGEEKVHSIVLRNCNINYLTIPQSENEIGNVYVINSNIENITPESNNIKFCYPLEYNFDNLVWNWEKLKTDGTVTAELKSETDENISRIIPATVTFETTASDCNTAGKTVYTAKIVIGENEYTDTYEETEAAVHLYSIVSWTWNDDHTSCTANLKCDRCAEESIVVITDITHEHVSPTATQEGYDKYTASVEIDGQTYSDTAEIPISAVNANDLDEQECNAFDAGNARSISETILEAISTEEKPETYAMSPWRGGTTFVADDHGYVYVDQNEVRVSSYRIAELLEEQGFITSASQFTQGHRSPLVEDGMEVAAEYIYRRPACSSLLCKSKENWYRYQVNICYRDGAIKLTYSAASKDGEIRNDTNMSSLDNTIDRGASQKFAEAVGIGEADFYTSLGPVSECDATDHEYTPVWSWSDEFDSCTAVLECKNCEVKTDVITATISKVDAESYDAACETTGQNKYIAEVIYNGKTYTDTKVQSVPALGHLNTVTSWTWPEDHTSCTVNLKCSRCNEESSEVITDITHEHADPTAVQDGYDKYTASLEIGGQTYSDTAVIPISADDIKAVNAKILNVIKGNVQGELGDAIDETRAAYDALPDLQKGCIDTDNYSIFAVIERLYLDNKKIKSDSDEAIQNLNKQLEDALKAADEAKQKATDAQNAKAQAEADLQNVRQELEQAIADRAAAESNLNKALEEKNAAVANAEQALKDKIAAEEKALNAEKAKAEAEENAQLSQADKEAAEKYAEDQRKAAASAQAKYEEQKVLADKAVEEAAEAKKALEDANNAVEELKGNLEDVSGELETALNESEEAKSALDEAEKTIDRLTEEKENAEESASQVADKLDVITQENDDLKGQIDSLTDDNISLQAENDKLGEDNAALQNENDKLESDNATLQNENDKLEAENATLHNENDKLGADNAALQSENDKLVSDNEQLQNETDELKADNDALRAEIERLNAEIEALKAEIAKLRAEIDELKAEIAALNAEIEALRAENESLKAENAVLKAENEEIFMSDKAVEAALKEARNDLDKANKELDKAEKEKAKAEEKLRKAEQNHSDSEDKLNKARADLEEAEARLINATAGKEAAEARISELLDIIEKQDSTARQALADKKAAEARARQAEADLADAEARANQAEANKEAAEARAEQAKADKAAAEAIAEKVLEEKETVKSVLDQIRAEIESAEAVLDELKSENESLAEENAALKAEAAEVSELIAEIGNVELTEKCRDSILAARTAYEKLTYGQKTLVLNSVDLVVAEKTYESLELSANDVIEGNETSEPEANTETDIPENAEESSDPQIVDNEHSEPETLDNITVSEPENPSDDVPEEIISEQNNEDENETPQISEASLSEVDVEKFIEEILPQTGVTGSRSMYVFALIMIVAGAYMIRKSKKEV